MVHEDIEVISDTIPQLESFHQQHSTMSEEGKVLLEEIKAFSTSAISNSGVQERQQELEVSGQWSMVIGLWSIACGQWSMAGGRSP